MNIHRQTNEPIENLERYTATSLKDSCKAPDDHSDRISLVTPRNRTTMETLSPRAFILQSDDYVKIFRKVSKKPRAVSVPMELVQWTIRNRETIKEAKPTLLEDVVLDTTLKTWKIVIHFHQGLVYMAYTKFVGGGKDW